MRQFLIYSLFAISSFLLIKISSANPNFAKKNFMISIGVYQVTSEETGEGTSPDGSLYEIPLPIGVANVKVHYELLQNLEIGSYLAYSNMGHKVPLTLDSEGMYVLIDSEGVKRFGSNRNNLTLQSNTLFYGIMARYDLLPLLTGKENLRFNLHISPQFGLVSARWNELVGTEWEMNWNGPFVEYGVGIGAGYFFTKRIGIGISYSIGQFYNNDNSRWYGGISYKF